MSTRSEHCGLILRLLAACMLLAACARVPQPTIPTPTATPPPSPSAEPTPSAAPHELVLIEPPEPESSSVGSLAGALYSLSGRGPIPGTTFFLTAATGEGRTAPPSVLTGAKTTAGDILATSGANGEFAFDAIPPGRYYLAVWAPYDWILAVQSETDDTPRLIEVEAGQRLDLGRVDVPWP